MKLSLLVLFSTVILSLPTQAKPLENENLLQQIPPAYQMGYQKKINNQLMVEWVPKGETVNNWNDMITTQIFYGGIPSKLTPLQFFEKNRDLWAQACPNAISKLIRQGNENGYPFVFWLAVCPKNPSTGKLEFTYLKAIQGHDSFYVIQKATKTEPTKAYLAQWTQYMRQITVCDSRIKESKCPVVNE